MAENTDKCELNDFCSFPTIRNAALHCMGMASDNCARSF